MSVYGTIVSPSRVGREIVRVLQAWSPSYLAAVAGQVRGDPSALQPVARWRRISRMPADLPDDQLPLALTVSNGTADVPQRAGRALDTWIVIEHGVIAAGGGPDGEEDANDLANDYAIAHALALLQKAKTSPVISEVRWRGMQPSNRFTPDETYAMVTHTFWVRTEAMLTVTGGPSDPPVDPTAVIPDPGQVLEVDLTLTAED